MAILSSQRARPRPAAGSRAATLAPKIRLSGSTFIAHTQPGLEGIAIAEAMARIPGATEAGRRTISERGAMAIIAVPQPQALLKLRCIEDLFAPVAYVRPLAAGDAGLEQARRLMRSSAFVEPALRLRAQLAPGSHSGQRLSFRVIARTVGEHEFRRVDLQRAIERGISERGERRWRLHENGEVEFWVTMLGDELLVALRLSDDRMRQREYKTVHLPGSLRPSVAAALAWLSEPCADDIVLDPLCGAGTILIERAHMGRYRMLLGGDHDSEALAAARDNIGPRYKPIEVRQWDAAALPLEDASVTRVITNLPWGRQMGSHPENQRLYPRLVREFKRVLAPGGKLVLLSGDARLLRETLTAEKIAPARILRVTVLGAPASIFVCNV